MMSYIERLRKAQSDLEAAIESGDGNALVTANLALRDLQIACQPQVEALVEAVAKWREEFWSMEKRGDVMAASVALDARADEVAPATWSEVIKPLEDEVKKSRNLTGDDYSVRINAKSDEVAEP